MERWEIELDEYMERRSAEDAAAAEADLGSALDQAWDAWVRTIREGLASAVENVRDLAKSRYNDALRYGTRHWYPEA